MILLALIAGCGKKVSSTNGESSDAALTTRQENLKRNIEFHLRDKLGGRPVTVGAIEDGDLPGFDKSTFSVGREEYPILVSKDDEHILLLAAEPFTNLSGEEMAKVMKREADEERNAAKTRAAALTAESTQAPVRGNPNAPVTIIEFSDFQCPYCRRGFDTMGQILEKHGSEVRFVYMQFPLSFHPWARSSAIASVCAAQQDTDAFWKLHDYYFQNQASVKPGNVVEKSKGELSRSNIRLQDWEACVADTTSDAHAAAVSLIDRQILLGRQAGVNGTPGFFVNGTFINGAQPIEVFEKAIEDAKARL